MCGRINKFFKAIPRINSRFDATTESSLPPVSKEKLMGKSAKPVSQSSPIEGVRWKKKRGGGSLKRDSAGAFSP